MKSVKVVLERLEASVALESVDRNPVFPLITTAAPRLYGITQAEAWRNHDLCREAMLKCFRDYGFDLGSKPNYYYPMLPGKFCGAPVRNLIPGKQLPEDALYQVEERVLFSRDDYKKIAAMGWNSFWREHYPRLNNKSIEDLAGMMSKTNKMYYSDLKICEEQGMPIIMGVFVDSVLMAFSMCRTLTEFTRDLYEAPDLVEKAMIATCDDLIANAIEVCKKSNKKYAWVVLERGSGFYYRLETFERFEWPFLQRYVDAFVSEGITPWLHFDTDWSINLPYLKKLPRGKCVLDLDGTTDIFRAHELLGDHMCISGDVPAALLSLGSVEEVNKYCRKLIDTIGAGGGFLLTTGCECPIDVKADNLRAMVDTGLHYRGEKSKAYRRIEEVPTPPVEEKLEGGGKIVEAFRELHFDAIGDVVNDAVSEGGDPWSVIEECKMGMDQVSELYSRGEYFLGELVMAAQTFERIVKELEPRLFKGQEKDRKMESVVIGTPQGDIHDIGKNVVATVFKAAGFQVHDVGVDVSAEDFVAKVEETEAKIVAMSALITPTFQAMKDVVDLLIEKGLRQDRFVIIGGGPTTETVRDFVGADAWSIDPKEGANLCLGFIQQKSGK